MKMLTSAFSLQPSALANWLPDMDLNHDKQIQSLLCYRYTIGQAGAFDRLNGFPAKSSRQTGLVLKESNGFNVRPRPGPLPRGEGEATRVSRTLGRHRCSRRLSAIRRKKLTTICIVLIVNNRRIILPLLGERAGARADVITNFSESRITFHVSRN
jgi:hypothetical protein